MQFVELFILVFAVFGTTFTLHYTDGPGDLLVKFRSFLVSLDKVRPFSPSNGNPIVYDSEGNEVHIVEETEGFFQKLLNCFWCSSFWVALVVVGCYYLLYGYPIKSFPFVLAASIGVSGFLHESIARD
jgi:hypothetical protein